MKHAGPNRPFWRCDGGRAVCAPVDSDMAPRLPCGDRVAVDEDGCCATCGADAVTVYGKRTERRLAGHARRRP